jgi:RNA polymerase sigma-70 factor, ECF subfamily
MDDDGVTADARAPWQAHAIEQQAGDDAALVRAVERGDQRALNAIYDRHVDACFGLARRVVVERALAEEVVQEVFVRLWRQPQRFDPERGSLRSFLLAQVHGRSVDLLRAETARRAREERDARREITAMDDIERRVLDLAQADAVRSALESLSPGEREAIELAYFGGHTYRDVAVLLEQPEGTVKSRIRAGLLRLRAALIEAGYTQP